MTLSDQCCTLPQAKRLKELGVVQESYFVYGYVGKHITESWAVEGNECTFYAAWTVAELGLALGKRVKDIFLHGPTGMWTQKITMNPNMFEHQAHCYANWLIHCLENKYITPDEVNKRVSK